MSPDLFISAVRQLHDDYRTMTADARAKRDRAVAEADATFAQDTVLASTVLARGLSELLDEATAAEEPAAQEPPPAEPAKAEPAQAQAPSRDALKAEIAPLEHRLREIAPGPAVGAARKECGLDLERSIASSKASAETLGRYLVHLRRLVAENEAQPREDDEVERPRPEPPVTTATHGQLEMEGLF
jgi:hypothetical protein